MIIIISMNEKQIDSFEIFFFVLFLIVVALFLAIGENDVITL
jgi:hypothetical protein